MNDLAHLVTNLGLAEPVSSLLHYLSAVAAILAAPPLLRACGGCPTRRIAATVFVVALAFLFVASGTFHALERGTVAREVARRVDHAAISTLIAATLTAIHGLAVPGGLRSRSVRFIWAIAATGIVLEALWVDALPGWVWLAFYLSFGWVAVVGLAPIALTHRLSTVGLLLGGGTLYTVGALLDFAGTPIVVPDLVGPHEVFHLAVSIAALLHWHTIRDLVTGPLVATAHAAGSLARHAPRLGPGLALGRS